MVARFQFKHHVAPLLLLGCLHALHLLVLYMVSCLCHDSNPWATYMVWQVCRKLHKVILHGAWTSCGMYFICVPWTQTIGQTSQLCQNLCAYNLLGVSNTKCTHLGGVYPIVCDFETNMFTSLSFVVSQRS